MEHSRILITYSGKNSQFFDYSGKNIMVATIIAYYQNNKHGTILNVTRIYYSGKIQTILAEICHQCRAPFLYNDQWGLSLLWQFYLPIGAAIFDAGAIFELDDDARIDD